MTYGRYDQMKQIARYVMHM